MIHDLVNLVQTMTVEKENSGVNRSQDIQKLIEAYAHDMLDEQDFLPWLQAVYKNGLTAEETKALTFAMRDSGDVMSWHSPQSSEIYVDKHSTGGVGDKTSLIVAPLVASLDIPVIKLSGRGLGHTGGTVDKLESIPGCQVVHNISNIHRQLTDIGLFIGSATEKLAPADKKMYDLRHRKQLVDQPALIASSIVSKKLAAGADGVVFDIKVGKGAFMKTLENARALALGMNDLMFSAGKKSRAVLSSMDEPLGTTIGNALEIQEVLAVLKGETTTGPLVTLCLALASEMVGFIDVSVTPEERKEQLMESLISGKAHHKFLDMVQYQGGHLDELSHMESEFTFDFYSDEEGYISEMNAYLFGEAANRLGAGRFDGKSIDPMSGIVLYKKVGDPVFPGERIAQLHYEITRAKYLYSVLDILKEGISVTKEEVNPKPIILDMV